ncbi:hypothetical protein ACN27F_12950 [Solwaraspora sp. WMMB335]|uniref:hypothetical protein n=1 Tax=Solwaraspora sp. WMMB335 TaxID=3404118 RepID=UPI003B925C22
MAVRVNHPDDVRAAKSAMDLPVIALHKEQATGRGELPVGTVVARRAVRDIR